MANPLNLALGAVDQSRPGILYGVVSSSQPAPVSFASTLFVVFPQWDASYNWQFSDWPACHGSTLPAQGATVIVVRDDQRNLRVVWWDSATTAFAATSISGLAAGGDLSGTYPNPTVAQINGTAVPLTGSAWNAPLLINSWVAVTTVGYLKDPLGFVHLRGSANTGTSATAAFVLPAGFRPGVSDFWPALQSSGSAGSFVEIDSTGNVTPTYAGTRIWFTGITFLAEN